MALKQVKSSSSENKKKHITLILNKKFMIIEKVEYGVRRVAIIDEFKIGSSTI